MPSKSNLFCFILFFVFGREVLSKFYKNYNLTDFSKCKVHYSRTGSLYRDFYEIADESRENDSLLDFHFSVLAPSDAHILFAPSSKIIRGDPVYEIVIGAGGNTFSDIRKEQKSAVKASSRLKGLLSALDVRSFWVHISKGGLIEVGREGEELAFLTWMDPDPLPLKVFSFSTWPGVEAKWFFDCPRGDNVTTDSKEVVKNLTDFERLRKDLLLYYDPYVQPLFDSTKIMNITMTLGLFYLSLDEYRAVAEMKGTTKMKWEDEKLKWDPSKYGNIDSLHIYRREIWRPDLILLDSVDSGRDILSDTMLVVNYEGEVEWNPQIKMACWCNATELGHWPSDFHKIKIKFGFGRDHYNLNLKFENDSFILKKHPQWDITEVDFITNFQEEKFDGGNFQLWMTIKRRSNTYTVVFFTPFLLIALSLLSVFWCSPYGQTKISLGCLSLILSCMMLIALSYFIPAHPQKVPYLVLLYSYTLTASVISVVISIITINLSRIPHKYSVPQILERILTSWLVKNVLLGLPDLKVSKKQYGDLNDITSMKNPTNVQEMWFLLAVAIDRIAFQVYFILTAFAFFIKY